MMSVQATEQRPPSSVQVMATAADIQMHKVKEKSRITLMVPPDKYKTSLCLNMTSQVCQNDIFRLCVQSTQILTTHRPVRQNDTRKYFCHKTTMCFFFYIDVQNRREAEQQSTIQKVIGRACLLLLMLLLLKHVSLNQSAPVFNSGSQSVCN